MNSFFISMVNERANLKYLSLSKYRGSDFTKQKRHPKEFSISQENVSKEQISTCKQTRRNNSELKVEIRYSSNHCKRKVERIRTESGREEKRRHGRTSRGRE